MFEWLFRKKTDENVNLLEVITASLNKLQLASLAEEKAVNMIANAIAKSEIVLSTGKERDRGLDYYRLNVAPNDNQTGTDFWYQVARKLLKTGDCVIVQLQSGKYYMTENYRADDKVTMPKRYENITITDGIDTYPLGRGFNSDEVIHLRYGNPQLRLFRELVLRSYNDAVNALNQMVTVTGTPKLKYKVAANMSFRTKDENGNDVILTIDQVMDKLKKQIEDSEISIIRETEGTALEFMDTKKAIPSNELKNMAHEINDQCAMAYDIPIDVFNGKITEKSDATNEFITYAVQPVAEVITDSLNAKMLRYLEYRNGKRVFVWLARFKHVDVIDSANSLDKLRGIGFNFDEIREMVGYEALNTEWSQARALTKNYTTEGLGEGGSAEAAEDPAAEELGNGNPSMSKHRERRKKRYEEAKEVLQSRGES